MACDGIVGIAPPDDVVGQLKAIAAVVRTDFAGSSWRLFPFAIVALALPFVLKPIVTGTPPLPEPRCVTLHALPCAPDASAMTAVLRSPGTQTTALQTPPLWAACLA